MPSTEKGPAGVLAIVGRVRDDGKHPTGSGLLVRGITKAAGLVARIHAAGVGPRTGFDASTALARQAAHRIGCKLRRRSEDAKADVLAITGELVEVAEIAVEQARRVLLRDLVA